MPPTLQSSKQNTKEQTCQGCQTVFVCQASEYIAQFVKYCPECSDRQAEADQREAIRASFATQQAAGNGFVPAAFQDTVPHKLPRPERLQRVLAWQYGPKGLVMHGPTGNGKSRCLWELLKRQRNFGRKVRVLDHGSSYDYAAMYSRDTAAASTWVQAHSVVDLLALDDIFKAKLTDSFEQALFTIVSTRTERGLPLIVTCNDVGDSIAARMSPDRGPAFVRRLREFCTSIPF